MYPNRVLNPVQSVCKKTTGNSGEIQISNMCRSAHQHAFAVCELLELRIPSYSLYPAGTLRGSSERAHVCVVTRQGVCG
jgi:hypothetical protein